MKPTLNVYALPRLVAPEELLGGTAVVIDVLRASTTIAYALDAGATEVLPCLEVADAMADAKQFSPDQIILGGERDGVLIDGFDLGNSPDEYTPERVSGKTVIFTTTNGTRAMMHAQMANEVFVAAFVNAAAVVAKLLDRQKIHIICGGTDGRISDDDVLVAGLLVDRIQRQTATAYQENTQALTAREFWLNAFPLPQAIGAETLPAERLAERMRTTLGAQNLINLGLDADILAASQLDRFFAVSQLDTKSFRIRRTV